MPNADIGPTWQDVYDYTHRLELMWGVVVYHQMRLHLVGRPERLCGQVTAVARQASAPLGGEEWYGTYGFKGNSGAKTMPQACWHALSELEGRLAGVDKVRQRELNFGG